MFHFNIFHKPQNVLLHYTATHSDTRHTTSAQCRRVARKRFNKHLYKIYAKTLYTFTTLWATETIETKRSNVLLGIVELLFIWIMHENVDGIRKVLSSSSWSLQHVCVCHTSIHFVFRVNGEVCMVSNQIKRFSKLTRRKTLGS